MELSDAIAFARTTRQSVLTTIRRNGRPQLSNVLHTVGDDGLIRISITADRAKYKNLAREPWAALHVTRETVKTNVSSVLAKFGARNRTHAAVLALDAGLVTW